ncbi:Bifunctional protein PyrR [Candidatus Izimaplasma bacterium HR1]|jgi:pyrimidine operon attenuation protein/uracil phosphoribosyltransferase|uniref:bifunctional pyr operon transcriptional regulator/uracil phosphoribosyltransferase PyrR n=1 Tax=Candidatus Izimoplasma sp. HR1 TaxID=1541959 RepID=UPI0004F847F2|nr:Bifunctional protein PyrR [Candidatus Izimaplasma bacterium HR1]
MSKIIIDNETMKRTLRRLAYEIIEQNEQLNNVVLLGIRKKGVIIASIIQENILKIEGVNLETYEIDITPYRDDIESDIPKSINKEYVKSDLTDKIVILVDDVLYTGRTVRAAMDAIIDLGRPSKIELAVLVDRGHRQLPIRANFIGKNIPTSSDELVKVTVTDLKGQDKVEIIK